MPGLGLTGLVCGQVRNLQGKKGGSAGSHQASGHLGECEFLGRQGLGLSSVLLYPQFQRAYGCSINIC